MRRTRKQFVKQSVKNEKGDESANKILPDNATFEHQESIGNDCKISEPQSTRVTHKPTKTVKNSFQSPK